MEGIGDDEIDDEDVVLVKEDEDCFEKLLDSLMVVEEETTDENEIRFSFSKEVAAEE